jgi:hypothetical protein
MDDRDFADLVFSIYQGSERYWSGVRPRFAGLGPVCFFYDSRQHDGASEIASLIADVGQAMQRTIQAVDLGATACENTPQGQKLVSDFADRSAGIIAAFSHANSEVVSLVLTVASRRPEVPILALLLYSPTDDRSMPLRPPLMMRSRHNMCVISMPHGASLGEVIKGFLHDRWTDSLAVLDIERKMAARHGTARARRRDARKIVEAYYARKCGLI